MPKPTVPHQGEAQRKLWHERFSKNLDAASETQKKQLRNDVDEVADMLLAAGATACRVPTRLPTLTNDRLLFAQRLRCCLRDAPKPRDQAFLLGSCPPTQAQAESIFAAGHQFACTEITQAQGMVKNVNRQSVLAAITMRQARALAISYLESIS